MKLPILLPLKDGDSWQSRGVEPLMMYRLPDPHLYLGLQLHLQHPSRGRNPAITESVVFAGLTPTRGDKKAMSGLQSVPGYLGRLRCATPVQARLQAEKINKTLVHRFQAMENRAAAGLISPRWEPP